jgi:hypothetical protein
MLPAIYFNNQASFQTNKIQHIIQVWLLAAEFAARQLPPPQPLPQAELGIGHVIP